MYAVLVATYARIMKLRVSFVGLCIHVLVPATSQPL